MASLKEIKTRISSVKTTLKTTSAMKMVASAKLHKAQTAIGNMLPYEQHLRRILAGLLQSEELREALKQKLNMGRSSSVILEDVNIDELPSKDRVARVAVVGFSSNSSLCGAFNANAVKKFTETIDALLNQGYTEADIDVYAVGAKIAAAACKIGLRLNDFSDMAEKPSYEKASELASKLIDSFASEEVSQIILIYNHFASPVSQPSVRENYLPLALKDFASVTDSDDEKYARSSLDYTLEPDPMSLVRELLPKVLLLRMYTVCLDANTAAHAARTMAMQIASDNAADLIAELTLAYNKGRQDAITAEILDLAGGTVISN